jgi:hypothetical protein
VHPIEWFQNRRTGKVRWLLQPHNWTIRAPSGGGFSEFEKLIETSAGYSVVVRLEPEWEFLCPEPAKDGVKLVGIVLERADWAERHRSPVHA